MEKSLGIFVDRSSRWWWLCVFLSRVLTRVVQVASFAPNVCDSLSNKLLAIYKFFNLNNMSKRARVQLVGKLTCHQTQTLNFSDRRTRDKETEEIGKVCWFCAPVIELPSEFIWTENLLHISHLKRSLRRSTHSVVIHHIVLDSSNKNVQY